MTTLDGAPLEIEIRGTRYPVELYVQADASDASFRVHIAGDWIRADSWTDLRAKATEASKKSEKPLDIEITVGDHRGFADATVYAVHAGTGNPMVRWERDGTRGQLDSYTKTTYRRLTDLEKAALVAAGKAYDEAQTNLGRLQRGFSIDLRKAIQEARS